MTDRISMSLKDFLYLGTLVVGLTVSHMTIGSKATAAETQAKANKEQIAANSQITAGYDVIIARLNMIDGSIKELKTDIQNLEAE